VQRRVKLVSLLIFLFIVTNSPVSAQSIAASLSTYQKSFETDIAGISGTSTSGVTFHPGSKTLFIVDDANTTVFEISLSGVLIRSITLSGFEDTEGIAYHYGDYFFLVEERLANVVRARMPQAGSGPVSRDSCTALNLGPNMGNSGLEDIACTATPAMAYAVKESAPPRLYRITLDGNGNPAGFSQNDPFNIEAISGDAAGLFVLSDGNFLILSQEENKLKGYNPTGEKLSEVSLGMTKPEGITVDQSDSTIYIVGEPRQLFILKKTGTSAALSFSYKLSICFSSFHNSVLQNIIVVRYSLPCPENIRLDLFSLSGKKIATFLHDKRPAATGYLAWNAGRLPAGAYVCRFKAGIFSIATKEILF